MVKLNRRYLAVALLMVLALLLIPIGKVIPTGSLVEQQVRQGVRLLERDFGGLGEHEARHILEDLARFHRGAPVDATTHRRADGTLFVTPELNGYALDIDATWYRLVTAPPHVEVAPAVQMVEAATSARDFPLTAIDRGNPKRNAVALLINVDWGEQELPAMLTILRTQGAKATFFVSGRFTDKFPQLIQQASREGHEIASHGYDLSHGPKDWAAQGKLRSDIERSVTAIERATGRKVTYWAPHMSEVSPEILATAHQLNLRTILYSVDTIDWRADSTTELILSRAAKAKAGDFVLLHPKPNTVRALGTMIAAYRQQGLSLLTLSDILSPEPQVQGGPTEN